MPAMMMFKKITINPNAMNPRDNMPAVISTFFPADTTMTDWIKKPGKKQPH